MYSIVMLSALAPGADVTPAPAAPVVVVGGCTGSCLGSYAPAGCSGSYALGSCHGVAHGHFGHRAGGFLGHKAQCHGGGYSCSGFNCFGSCYGSYIAGYASCHGCHGAFAAGSTWGPAVGMAPYTLHGYNSTVWGAAYAPGAPVMAAPGVGGPNPPPVMTVPVAPMTKPAGSDGQGANLKFSVPADAKLFVDGKPTTGGGTERTFYTPPLAPGQKFFYDVKVELLVDGRTVTEEKRVIVESGASVTESFPKLTAAAASATSVAGK